MATSKHLLLDVDEEIDTRQSAEAQLQFQEFTATSSGGGAAELNIKSSQTLTFNHSPDTPGSDGEGDASSDLLEAMTALTVDDTCFEKVYFDLETSGLSSHSEVIQIAALYGQSSYNVYILPQWIPQPVTEVTGLKRVKNNLLLHGKQVLTISKLDAWNGFVKFLLEIKKNVILVGHNIQFDLRFLIKEIDECNLTEHIQELVHSCIDTLKVCKEAFPGRDNYKQSSIASDLAITFGAAHNAFNYVLTLRAIVHRVPSSLVEKHTFAYESYRLKKVSVNLVKATLLPLKDIGISAYMIEKIATAGITLQTIESTFNSAQADGVKYLFEGVCTSGKPLVTKDKKVIDTLIKYLQEKA